MNINTLKNIVVPFSFDYKYTNGTEQTEKISGGVRRGKLNLTVIEELEKVKEQPKLLAPILFGLLESWSLTEDDDGKIPYELTESNIAALPNEFLNELTVAVMETATGKPTPAKR